MTASGFPENPIGVFDSGVGGLSVLRAIREELPAEDLIYVGDSGCAPYGERPARFVSERASAITRFLLDQGSKAVVIACNTATSIAVRSLRSAFDVPIVAIEPAVKPAASRTRSRVVGVLATTSTLSSENMANLLEAYGRAAPPSVDVSSNHASDGDVRFLIQACPGLADQVEKGELSSENTRELVTRYVRPLVDQGADILVLGCTHYPFLRPLIEEIAGPGVDLIDPAAAVARELRRRLDRAGLLRTAGPGREEFWTSGAPDHAGPLVRQIWGHPVEVRRVRLKPATT